MILLIGRKLVGMDYGTLVNVKSGLSELAITGLLVRLAVFLSIFTVGWKPMCKLALRQSGLDMHSYRWKWMGFYIAAELVIFSTILGGM